MSRDPRLSPAVRIVVLASLLCCARVARAGDGNPSPGQPGDAQAVTTQPTTTVPTTAPSAAPATPAEAPKLPDDKVDIPSALTATPEEKAAAEARVKAALAPPDKGEAKGTATPGAQADAGAAGAKAESSSLALPPPASSKESPEATQALSALVERQKDLVATDTDAPNFDEAAFRSAAQQLANDYEAHLRRYPDSAAACAAYGLFLGHMDMRRQSVTMLLKANRLDPGLPLVKNQLGNYMAEEGRPLDALQYFLAASDLAPEEPLYHYQIGNLIATARPDFEADGSWTTAALDRTMLKAFQRAAELAPDNLAYAYRAAEAYYDLANPDWNEALAAWQALMPRFKEGVEQQTLQLHQANCLLHLGRKEDASKLLEAVDEPVLQAQKQKLVEQLAAKAKE